VITPLLLVAARHAAPPALAALVAPVPVDASLGPTLPDLGCAIPEACRSPLELACPTADPTGSDPQWKRCIAGGALAAPARR